MAHASWQHVLPGVLRFPDSCNVYALAGPEGVVIVDAGTGAWLDAPGELPGEIVALLCTHYFRDHAAGAFRAAAVGIPVYVPEGERELFEEPALHFLRRESFVAYTNTWDHFAPIAPVPVAGVLRDYELLRLAGLDLEVVPLPGATVTQVGVQADLPGVGTVVACGEAIHSPGRVARLAPLQYGYGDLPGALAAIESARELRRRRPVALLPSLGVPLLDDVDAALSSLQRNLRAHGERRTAWEPGWQLLDGDPLLQVSDHVWQSTSRNAAATFVVAPSGKVLAIDCGYDELLTPVGASASAPHRRRGSIRAARALLERVGAAGIDVVLVSHYHDDHVAGIPLLQRVYGTSCWCPGWFADILERPHDFAFPCTWPVPIDVGRRLDPGVATRWEGIDLTCTPMSGHTRFSAALELEIDGLRIAHLGDQVFSVRGWEAAPGAAAAFDWERDELWPTHVYRNGAALGSFAETAAWLAERRPDLVLGGHQPPMRTSDAFFRRAHEWGARFDELHRDSMTLADEEPHFGLDALPGWIVPYRVRLPSPGRFTVRATLRNPLPCATTLEALLVGPPGWVGEPARAAAPARGEVELELAMVAGTRSRRQPVAVELRAGGRPFGQVAEALVTVGPEPF